MSEHLPIIMNLAIDTVTNTSAGVNTTLEQSVTWKYNALVTDKLCLISSPTEPGNEALPYVARIFDLTGKLLSSSALNNTAENYIPPGNIADGIYLLTISQINQTLVTGKFVKMASHQP